MMLTKIITIHCDECNNHIDTDDRYERDARNLAWKNDWSQNTINRRKVDLCPDCTKRLIIR